MAAEEAQEQSIAVAPTEESPPDPIDLVEAIEETTPDRLQQVLLEICDKLPAAAELANSLLLVPLDDSKTDGAENSKKRKRWEVCLNCEEEFDVTDNKDDACRFHPGQLQPNEERFKDLDVPEEEDWDNLVDELPEYFDFSCCKKDGDQDGCTLSKHIIARVVRVRIADDDDDDDDDDNDEEED